MIQQHCYTKSQKGLFRKSAGYDTVARSDSLSEEFIKERLHPFCYYHPSKALQALRVPAVQFPRALRVIQFPDGQMLLGQTVYIEADYTGQRPTFFTHNYLLPRPDDLSPKAMETMLRNTIFLTRTEWGHLPELKELPVFESAGRGDPVGPLPFDELRLARLVAAVMEAVAGTRKVYVLLPDPEWVIPVLAWLYSRLPGAAVPALGFCSYSREPENKKYLHLIFMEKGSLLTDDPRVEGDFVFDFDSGNFSPAIPEITEEGLEEMIRHFYIPEKDEEYEEAPKHSGAGIIKEKAGLMARVKRILKK
jgi:hypothetical protein